ncbi:MAG: hypothetical protein HQ519_04900 [Planctomycetes bacterium]|nr:hypothetical protein [Planctomycetota bacterium]
MPKPPSTLHSADDRLDDVVLNLLGRWVRVTADDADFLNDFQSCFHLSRPASGKDFPTADLSIRVETFQQGTFTVHSNPSKALADIFPCRIRNGLDLCSLINQWAVGDLPTKYIFHSGAVAKNQKALLMPANSGSGKTTLTASLLRRGFELLSDEVAAVDLSTKEVATYPRLMSIRGDVVKLLGLNLSSGHLFEKDEVRFVCPEEFGSQFSLGGVTAHRIIFPHFSSETKNHLKVLSPGKALIRLVESSCSQKQLKVFGFDWLIELVQEIPCFSLEFSNLDKALDLIEGVWE